MAVELIKDRFALLTLLFGHEDTASNKVCSMIKLSKKHQYSEILNENANNPASVWKLFKEIGASKRKGSADIFSLKTSDNVTENPKDIANEFNKFFVTVASKIKEPIETSNFDKLQKFCNEKIPADTYFSIPDISCEKVEKYLKNIDLTKSTGLDNIGPRLLKLAAPFISDSLTYICNQSIINSTFPNKWKEGKVRPLHKNGPRDDTKNYRPISVLPVLSKLLEKHVHVIFDLTLCTSFNTIWFQTQSFLWNCPSSDAQ